MNKKQRPRFTPHQPVAYRPNYSLYDRLKQEWIDAHPGASHGDYQRAIWTIARKAGI